MLIRVKRGLDIPISGKGPDGPPVPGNTRQVAILGRDYRGCRLSVEVSDGDRVRAGEIVCTDRRNTDISIVAPGSGIVSEIRRGRGRRLESLVIDLNDDPPICAEPIASDLLARLSPDVIRRRLLESGLWPAFRARPYERIPAPDIEPRAIFVTGIDTRPLAPDPFLVIDSSAEAFRNGLTLLARLTAGPVYCCTANDKTLSLPDCDNLHHVRFSGPHPAGLPGTHIHALATVGESPDLWHIGYQDVLAIGEQFRTGILLQYRVIGVAGPGMPAAELQRVPVGARLSSLVPTSVRRGQQLVSGSVLEGHVEPGFLGRYHNQVTVLPESPHDPEPTGSRLRSMLQMLRAGNTARSGEVRPGRHSISSGMLPLAAFDDIWPYKSPAASLLRALLTGDVETAVSLGCRGLAEEDLALCTHSCVAGNDYGRAQRHILRTIEREGL